MIEFPPTVPQPPPTCNPGQKAPRPLANAVHFGGPQQVLGPQWELTASETGPVKQNWQLEVCLQGR